MIKERRWFRKEKSSLLGLPRKFLLTRRAKNWWRRNISLFSYEGTLQSQQRWKLLQSPLLKRF